MNNRDQKPFKPTGLFFQNAYRASRRTRKCTEKKKKKELKKKKKQRCYYLCKHVNIYSVHGKPFWVIRWLKSNLLPLFQKNLEYTIKIKIKIKDIWEALLIFGKPCHWSSGTAGNKLQQYINIHLVSSLKIKWKQKYVPCATGVTIKESNH